MITGAVAISYLIQPGTTSAPQPTQMQGNLEVTVGQTKITPNSTRIPYDNSGVKITFERLGEPYQINYDPAKRLDHICMTEDVDKLQKEIGIDKALIYSIWIDDEFYKFQVYPKEEGPKIEEQLRKIVENCFPKP